MSSDQGPAAARGKELGAAETQDTDIAPGSRLAPLYDRPRHLRGILDDLQTMPGGNLHDGLHGGNTAMQVRNENGPCPGPNGLLQLPGFESAILRVHIDQ